MFSFGSADPVDWSGFGEKQGWIWIQKQKWGGVCVWFFRFRVEGHRRRRRLRHGWLAATVFSGRFGRGLTEEGRESCKATLLFRWRERTKRANGALSLKYLFLYEDEGWRVEAKWPLLKAPCVVDYWVNQGILCGSPHHMLVHPLKLSSDLLTGSKSSDPVVQSLLTRSIVDQALRALLDSFWANPGWAQRLFLPNKPPVLFNSAQVFGLFISNPFILFLWFFISFSIFKKLYILLIFLLIPN